MAKTQVEIQADIDREKEQIQSVPEEVRNYIFGTMYHVVFDCDFGTFYNADTRINYETNVLKKTMHDAIPIVYDKEYAVDIAKHLISKAVNKGSCGAGRNKKYPFLGAVVIGFQFIDRLRVKYNQTESNDLALYGVQKGDKQIQKGELSKKILDNIKIVEAEYVVRDGVDVGTGFGLLNLVPTLTSEDIHLLKKLYQGGGEKLPTDGQKPGEWGGPLVGVVNKGWVALGGEHDEYYECYVREKALYCTKKGEAPTTAQPPVSSAVPAQTGGAEPNWKLLHKQKKAEYRELKRSLAQR